MKKVFLDVFEACFCYKKDQGIEGQVSRYILAKFLGHPGTMSAFPGLCKEWEFLSLVVSNLVVCNFYVEALFCALLRPFALFKFLPFADLLCALLRGFACF